MKQEDVQGIVSRLSWQGFALKAISVIYMLIATFYLSEKVLAFYLPVVFFAWGLDALFLKLERNIRFWGVKPAHRVGCKYLHSFFSPTLCCFYLTQVFILCLILLEKSTMLS